MEKSVATDSIRAVNGALKNAIPATAATAPRMGPLAVSTLMPVSSRIQAACNYVSPEITIVTYLSCLHISLKLERSIGVVRDAWIRLAT